ncbi:DUF3040 domain-containing protein [Saccharothrix sp. AJ9571]|nr:DUF3040 domain-containing protein [Saccharothrix sp. AJ9571]
MLPPGEAIKSAAGRGDEGGALNDWERRQLDLIEQRLAEEDPGFAHTLRTTTGSVATVWTALALVLGVVALLGALAGDVSLLLVAAGCAVAACLLRRHHHRGGTGAHRRGDSDGR